MTKGNLIATSFVGAVPAGFLAYFSIMAFLNYSENMATMLQVVNGVTVLFSVLMALSPIAILIFMRSPGAVDVAAAPAAAAVSTAAAAASESEMTLDEDLPVESVDEFADDEFSADAGGTDEDDMSLSGFDDSLAPTSSASDDAFEFDDSEFELGEDDEK